MTRRDILFNTEWDEFSMGTCKLFVDFFDQYIPFILFQENDHKPQITDKMIDALNQILSLETKQQPLYFEKFADHPYNRVSEIHINQEHDTRDGIYSEIIMQTPSGHYRSLIVKDGKIIACDTDGSYFD